MDKGDVSALSKTISRVCRRLPVPLQEDATQTAWLLLLDSGRLETLGIFRAGYKFGRRATRRVVEDLPKESPLPVDEDGEEIEFIGELTDPMEIIILRELRERMSTEEATVFHEMYNDYSDREGKRYGLSYRDLGDRLGISKERAQRLMDRVRQIVISYLEGAPQ